MKKIIIALFGIMLVASIVGASCSSAITIVGSRNYTGALKCYGTLDTYNAITNKGSFYYNYEYSAFPGGGTNGIACENPVYNNDTGAWFGRNRGWGNNGTCTTLFGCPTGTVGPPPAETIYGTWGTNASSCLAYLLMEACPYTSPAYACGGGASALATYVVGPPITCGGATTGIDKTFHVPQPLITSVSPNCAVPVAGTRTCTLGISIAGPTAGDGIYGDTGNIGNLIKGYKMFYGCGISVPSCQVSSYTAAGSYIAYTGATSNGSITIECPETQSMYITYQYIFDNRADTAIATLDTNNMKPLNNGSLVVYPYLAAPSTYQPTPVTISSFTGKYINLQHIALTWVTASETDAAGFNLYRSLDHNNWTQVNSSLIPAKGQGGGGATYNLTDNLPKQRTYQKWYYKLDEISTSGQRAAQATTTVTR